MYVCCLPLIPLTHCGNSYCWVDLDRASVWMGAKKIIQPVYRAGLNGSLGYFFRVAFSQAITRDFSSVWKGYDPGWFKIPRPTRDLGMKGVYLSEGRRARVNQKCKIKNIQKYFENKKDFWWNCPFAQIYCTQCCCSLAPMWPEMLCSKHGIFMVFFVY